MSTSPARRPRSRRNGHYDPRREWMSEGYGLSPPERSRRLKEAAAECLEIANKLMGIGALEEAASYASAAGANLNYLVGYTYRVPTMPEQARIPAADGATDK